MSACYSQSLAREHLRSISRNGLTWLESNALSRFSWLAHGFSTRLGPGSRRGLSHEFNLGLTPDAHSSAVAINRGLFCGALGAFQVIASLRQIHSALVYQASTRRPASDHRRSDPQRVEYRPGGYPLLSIAPGSTEATEGEVHRLWRGPAGDSLLTADPGLLLTMRVADCLPVLIIDPKRRLVAAIHAGWRGALARIIEKTVGELRRIFSSDPADQVAVVGPGIGPCCYAVGEEVVEAFIGAFVGGEKFLHKPLQDEARREDRYTFLFHTQAPPGHARPRSAWHLDLKAVARAQLRAGGLKPSAIHSTAYCTACRGDLFFSHRREGTLAGRMMAAIGIRSPEGTGCE